MIPTTVIMLSLQRYRQFVDPLITIEVLMRQLKGCECSLIVCSDVF